LSQISQTQASERNTFAVKGEGTLFLPGIAWAGCEHRAAIVLPWEIVLKALKERLHVGVSFLSRGFFFSFLVKKKKKKKRKQKKEPCHPPFPAFCWQLFGLVIVYFIMCCLGFPVFLWPGYLTSFPCWIKINMYSVS